MKIIYHLVHSFWMGYTVPHSQFSFKKKINMNLKCTLTFLIACKYIIGQSHGSTPVHQDSIGKFKQSIRIRKKGDICDF